jgi:general secretion pathway protein G
MHPTKPSLRNSHRKHSSKFGFTLIELLVVIAVVGVLVSITFGVSRGVQTAQSRALAKAEMSVIAQALEQFKSRYGDYPWHDSGAGDYPTPSGGEENNAMLLYALTGRLKMERVTDGSGGTKVEVSKVKDELDDDEVVNRPQFIETSKFNVSGDSNEPNQILDPWGNPYIYMYKTEGSSNDWEVYGYHLYSTGPNGAEANETIKAEIDSSTGVMDPDIRETADAEGIIFAGE